VAEARHRVIATVACHSVARAGQPLNVQQMQGIVEGLMKAKQPTLCPHGRPTYTRMAAGDLTSLFGRTGWRRQ
jgi:DNA mismatch repair protein MutL